MTYIFSPRRARRVKIFHILCEKFSPDLYYSIMWIIFTKVNEFHLICIILSFEIFSPYLYYSIFCKLVVLNLQKWNCKQFVNNLNSTILLFQIINTILLFQIEYDQNISMLNFSTISIILFCNKVLYWLSLILKHYSIKKIF